ncbi:MAG TPA: FadR/GntR family transcriptional regulator [Dongiaceae bacterium]|nr:FadR/GntR family transcriptional regulator [Dongiaceae bacterium]
MTAASSIRPAVFAPGARAGRARSAQDQVLRGLGIAILRGDYPEGTFLPSEAELTERYAVSRTVLREVMKSLAAKGLLISRTKIGTRIRPQVDWNFFDAELLNWRLEIGLDLRFLESLYEIRLTVEPAAAALAAAKRNAEDIAALQELIRQMQRPGLDRAGFAAIDLDLHLRIAGASGNPFMRAIGNIIEAALITTLTETAPAEDPQRLRLAAANHAKIVDAIINGEAAAASQAMVAVIEEGRRNRLGPILAQAAASSQP